MKKNHRLSSNHSHHSLDFLKWFCPTSLYEGIEGDLLEQYEEDLKVIGEKKAKRRLLINVIKFFRPGIILRNKFSFQLIHLHMIRNYVKVAYRNILRSKVYSFVNIFGLSLGLAICLLMIIHIRYELSYETGFPKADLIYRVASTRWAKSSPTVGDALKIQMPEVKSIARLHFIDPQIIEFQDALTFSQHTYYADTSVFRIFDLQFIHGTPDKALLDKSSIVITKSIAGKIFREDVDPVGKTIMLDGHREFTVAGVIEDIPVNTHLKIDCLLPISLSEATTNDSKTWKALSTYALFGSPEDAAAVNSRMKSFQYRFMDGVKTKKEIDDSGDFFELHPIREIHLHSHREKETEANSDIIYIYIFSAFSILIILIASINFINLFTAQAIRRIKEIGVRKAIGAQREQLIFQFMGEAFNMVFIGGLLALLLATLALPVYNPVANVSFSPTALFSIENIILLFSILIATGLLSGCYPAFLISRYTATDSIRKNSLTLGNTHSLRKTLMVFQFFISLFLFTATLAVYYQMKFIHDKDIGFSKDKVLAVKLYGNLWVEATTHKEALEHELTKDPSIKRIALTDKLIGERFGFESFRVSGSPEEDGIQARYIRVDEGFIETLGIELTEGRGFEGLPDTVSAYILNEEAARLLKSKDIVGQYAANPSQGSREGRIMGIAKNFNYASLHQKIEPLVIEYRKQYPDYMLVRINGEQTAQAIKHTEAVVKKLASGTSLIYSFMDEKLNTLYKTENGLYQIVRIFSVLTIIIACLGLFALAAGSIESKKKEIGIRKVMGASIRSLLVLLSGEYLRLIGIAIFIAIPISYYCIAQWLTGFAYRIEVQWWMFVLPGMMIACFAWLIISIQSVKTARANPIDSLKYE